jgi:hypothetical protein
VLFVDRGKGIASHPYLRAKSETRTGAAHTSIIANGSSMPEIPASDTHHSFIFSVILGRLTGEAAAGRIKLSQLSGRLVFSDQSQVPELLCFDAVKPL